ncbi:Reverse transcriptase (RNA-dependent DNA polymerase) [Phytophthora infestans]|uniref:Reverse transcriptase (RNA-dependent DNA polymerase) n=1 Tax=Phytophthora infestans TaxID=4787 RepID=A0A833W8U1_PHYIN|nr:Reverse transcriptase (RNA-dependent DNA polymerase) [Phytophthora infestans]KAF4137655.1 Reverse transcriptase (RNA-dependent DNA polymerase) [Phytophthora infestans]
MIWRLKKALYGPKQAGKEWHDKINAFFTDYGFSATREDACVYDLLDIPVVVLLYVDDILIEYAVPVAMSKLVEALRAKYDVTYLGDITWFLGMRNKVDNEINITTIDQFPFATKILYRFVMRNCKPSALPLNSGCFLALGDEKNELADHIPYQVAVGDLLYLSNVSRPAVSVAVKQVAVHVNRPTVYAIKQILRDVTGALRMTLVYKRDERAAAAMLLTDADRTNNTENRNSISGFVVRAYGCAVAWITWHQCVVAKSSLSAEFIAASIEIEEARWTRMLL